MAEKICWHFALRNAFLQAMDDGALGVGPSHHGKPINWFSTCRDWAPTIFVHRDGALHCVSRQEAEHQGLYRFGVPVAQLLSGRGLRRRAMLSPHRWKQTLAAAAAAGADANRWCGQVGDLDMTEVIIDRFKEGQWLRLKRMRLVPSLGFVVLQEDGLDALDIVSRPRRRAAR